MKEVERIVRAYDALAGKEGLAMATVVGVEGSSYRRPGARMLILPDGRYVGGISGGCLEGDALRKAGRAIIMDRTELVTYDTTQGDEHQIGVGLGCEGIIDVLVAPVHHDKINNPVEVLRTCLHERNTHLLITVAESSSPELLPGMMLKYDGSDKFFDLFGPLAGNVKRDARHALDAQKSVVKSYEGLKLFHEVFEPPVHAVLFGGSYDIYPMAELAKALGWKVTLVTNPAKMSKSIFDTVDEVLPKGSMPPPDEYTVFVLMAHDEKTDRENLAKALQTPVPLIQMLGPLKRRNKIIDQLRKQGLEISPQALRRIHGPAGLDIGAVTPEEIALSVLAEMRAFFAGRPGTPLFTRNTPIHDR